MEWTPEPARAMLLPMKAVTRMAQNNCQARRPVESALDTISAVVGVYGCGVWPDDAIDDPAEVWKRYDGSVRCGKREMGTDDLLGRAGGM